MWSLDNDDWIIGKHILQKLINSKTGFFYIRKYIIVLIKAAISRLTR